MIPGIIHLIPNAALAGILIIVGFRLARPSEFRHAFDAGIEQLVIFLTTLVVTLLVDLLAGIGAGLAMKLFVLIIRGVKFKEIFRLQFDVKESENQALLVPRGSLIFTNLLSLTDSVRAFTKTKAVVIDFAAVEYIDHTSMAALVDLVHGKQAAGKALEMRNIDLLKPYSSHPAAARRA